jgi:hypothetical protein
MKSCDILIWLTAFLYLGACLGIETMAAWESSIPPYQPGWWMVAAYLGELGLVGLYAILMWVEHDGPRNL